MKKIIKSFILISLIFTSCDNPVSYDESISEIKTKGSQKDVVYPEIVYSKNTPNVIHINDSITVEKLDSLHIFEGDIVLSNYQITLIRKSNKSGVMSSAIRYWPNRTVYYDFSSDFTKQESVMGAIREWESRTSLKFLPRTSGTKSYIQFIHDDGNYSSLGMIGGKQYISLHKELSNVGTAIHEIGHAIGLFHEHTREDRDQYVRIIYDNIEKNKEHNFKKYGKGNGFDIGEFDFNSIMLYSSYAFPIDKNKPTIVLLNGDTYSANRYRLSTLDIEGIKSIYGPPFNKLTSIEEVYEDIQGQDWSSFYSKTENTIYFYEDEDCTIKTTLKYPRSVCYILYTTSGVGSSSQSTTYHQVNIPAGSDHYKLPETSSDIRYDYGNLVYNETTLLKLW
ncbi:MAG: M12 family metallopeptidase [Bacteroidales bacterium]